MLKSKVGRSVEIVNGAAREAETSKKMTYEQRPERNEDMCPENQGGEEAFQVESTACAKV